MSKIAIDARFYGLEHAGLGRYTQSFIKNLKEKAKNQEVVLLVNKKYSNLTVPKKWKFEIVDTKHYTLREQIVLLAKTIKLKPQLFHSLNTNIPFFYTLWGGKLIVTAHDLTQLDKNRKATTHFYPVYLVKLFLYSAIYFIAVKKARYIITPTNYVAKEIVKKYKIDKRKVKTIYEGIDEIYLKRHKLDSKKILAKYGLLKNKYFFYTGNLYPHKNIKKALEALQILNKRRKHKIKFAIAGSRNVFNKDFKKFLERQALTNNVSLLGFVEDKELSVLYENSLAFVYPSLSEGFGLPGVEALASGTLLLASDIEVFREVYSGNAIYFDPKSTMAIKSAMQKTISLSEKERIKKVKRAQKFVKKYSWSKMTDKIVALYENSHSL